jgi:hypothetical protein
MQKWEYYCQFGHEGEDQQLEQALNVLGQEGWELVTSVPVKKATPLSGDGVTVYWLKRAVS